MTTRLRARHFVVGLIGALLTLITGVGASSAGPPAGSTATRDATLAATPLAATGTVTATKAPTSRLAKTDPALLGRTDRTPIRVMIKLDYDSVATYQGGMAGLPATSPTVTGSRLTGASRAELRYGAHVARTERAIVADIQQSVPKAEIGESLRTVYGGVTAEIPANRVAAVLAVDGVVAVQRDVMRQPLTDSSPAFVGAPPVYGALGTTANAGEGVIYGNLDTGIWPEHPSFADLGNLSAPPGPARECNYGDNPLTPAVDVFVCQNKLIGGDHKTNTYDVVEGDDPYAGTARDGDGHGTHTSSTSAGNIVEDVEALGRDLPAIHGLAPGAWVMEYKVCGPQGCFGSDSASAVGQAILDGVDVINFSISGGEQPFSDPVELAFLDAYAAGVFVSASAGNAGPGAGTANHLSPWTTSVGASMQTREFATTLSLTATGGDTFTVDGASITAGAGPLPVALAQNVPGYTGGAGCASVPPPGVFAGRIIACQRGGQARVWKGFVVHQGGGAGMILYNPALADVETDNHWVPTVHLADGTSFLAFMTSHTGVTGSFPQGEPQDGQGDVMAAFSSRGPGGFFIKPDLTAPGVQILAGASPTPAAPDPVNGGSPPGNFYQAIAGTSMSSPHVAGAGILVRAIHPDWSPGQVRSALMTTAVTDVVKEDLTTPADPFDMGAGRIDIGDAILAPLTFDETADDFFALGNDPINAVHLNLPSIDAPVMPGRLTTNRVATNTSGSNEKFEVSTEAPGGSSITVTPKKFTLEPGASQSLTVVIESDAAVGQYFGEIQLSGGGHRLHLPVAWIRTQGSVALSQSCSPATIPVNGQTRCEVQATNNSFDTQVVDLDTFSPAGTTMVGVDGGAALVGPRHAQKHNVTLNGASPGVPSVAPGASPAGYLPLALFGVVPDPIGDEDIINYGVPPFRYNGQTWDTLGVDSNGYIVVGGGSAEDNNCCNLPAGADPARPNNILAPFWTDLDGTADQGIRAAVLTDGVDSWIVIEWQVDVFGTNSNRHFQVWLGIDGDANPAQDISFAYDPAALPADPNGQDFLVGAENQLGQGDVTSFLPTTDQVVTSTAATPGGVTTYGVTIRGDKKGTFVVTTEMEASGVPGTTIVRTPVLVQTP
jgi:Subtilase family/Fibronectin type-III domain